MDTAVEQGSADRITVYDAVKKNNVSFTARE